MFDFNEPREQEAAPDTEALRRELLDDLYACAFSGFPAVLDEEDEIRNADAEELERIAWRHGLR